MDVLIPSIQSKASKDKTYRDDYHCNLLHKLVLVLLILVWIHLFGKIFNLCEKLYEHSQYSSVVCNILKAVQSIIVSGERVGNIVSTDCTMLYH